MHTRLACDAQDPAVILRNQRRRCEMVVYVCMVLVPAVAPQDALCHGANAACRADSFCAADRIWEHFLQQAHDRLALPQMAVVATAMAETDACLRELWYGQQQHPADGWPAGVSADGALDALASRAVSLP